LRNRILGAIGVLWGGLILLGRLKGGHVVPGAGAYAVGQAVAVVLAVLMVLVGRTISFGVGDLRAPNRREPAAHLLWCEVVESYRQALKKGAAVIVFSDPIE
jgi:hypothetical protein